MDSYDVPTAIDDYTSARGHDRQLDAEDMAQAKDFTGLKQAVGCRNQIRDIETDHAVKSGVQTLNLQNIMCMRSTKNKSNVLSTSTWKR